MDCDEIVSEFEIRVSTKLYDSQALLNAPDIARLTSATAH